MLAKKAWAKTLFSDMVKKKWQTSKLEDLNAFSTSMVMRAAGFLVASGTFSPSEVAALRHPWTPPVPAEGEQVRDEGVAAVAKALSKNLEPSLQDIAVAVASASPTSFSVQKYPPKTTMAYWFIDGVSKASIDIDEYWEADRHLGCGRISSPAFIPSFPLADDALMGSGRASDGCMSD